MDIKAQIKEKADQLIEKLKNDKDLASKFQNNPVGVVEEYLGVDLPDDQINSVVEMIKAKVNLDKVSQSLGGLGKLFGK